MENGLIITPLKNAYAAFTRTLAKEGELTEYNVNRDKDVLTGKDIFRVAHKNGLIDAMIYVTDVEMKIVTDIIEEHADDCRVMLFGSRFKGGMSNGRERQSVIGFCCDGRVVFMRM